ncbi:beta-glucuronidase [Alkalibacterium iburiense]|uniref:Beta-glucuronidase n=1 Tax=Alkalibacterium iburiense TaxID=290589 RepID=A0ABP3H8V7_9LACT
MLYPINTESRAVIDLSGIWTLQLEKEGNDCNPRNPLKKGYSVAVPGSFNDQLVEQDVRTHIGNIWYETTFSIPHYLKDNRLVLRFGSVTHSAQVYLNGELITEHKGGFTPFEVEVSSTIKPGENRLTVCVSNIIDYTTLPVGVYSEEVVDGKTVKKVSENFDFFNYAGIHRPVKLYTTPKTFIEDVAVAYEVSGEQAQVSVQTFIQGEYDNVRVTLFNEDNERVATGEGKEAELTIEAVRQWEPLDSYLYTVKVEVTAPNDTDIYHLPVGIRTVEVKGSQFLINNKPFYFKGFGKHEDTYLHGRGLNEPSNVLDLNLMKQMGANSFRTSHYPYSEEMMRLADREGFVVIDETPAVSLYAGFNVQFDGEEPNTWDEMQTKEAHELVLKEMVERDKNHACVVMWSVANEPATHHEGAREYFEPLIELTRSLDPQNRPVTIVYNMEALPGQELTHDLVDVICLNRYYSWYLQTADLKAGEKALRDELKEWEQKDLNKPFLFTEYGADTVSGLHSVQDIPFTEEFQVHYYEMYHKVFDEFPFIVGEQVWNFADFETKVGTGRVQGNKKGIFNRAREPKMIAYFLKQRWLNIPEFDYHLKK